MTRIAIFDPFSGISGDMTLGALLQCGLDPDWLRALPAHLHLADVNVRIANVMRSGIACAKVDFDIPPQPHGRHLKHLVEIVDRSDAPEVVKERARQAFTAIATIEAAIHGTSVERVHLHEVGAVDAILDILGSLWGLELLGVAKVYTTPVSLGDGSVNTEHGLLPVPAPATMKLLEGLEVRPGPPQSGELVTPTGAALLKALNAGAAPRSYVPRSSGYGAGTKDFPGRPNALRLIIADETGADSPEIIAILAADIDDMSPEHLAAAAEELRSQGALDVVVLSTHMKKGRTGSRIEVLCEPHQAESFTREMLRHTTSLGVRRIDAQRAVLERRNLIVNLRGATVRVKVADAPGGARVKAELDDVRALSRQTALPVAQLSAEAETEARRVLEGEGTKAL